MEDFDKKESRKALTAELEVQQNYLSLVPRPSDEDYQRLKENIHLNGFDDTSPIKVNEDMVVLDGHTRLQIAKELGLEWVYVIVKDLPDHFAEKRYVIKTNLDQRHLNTPQRAELAVKLEEIKEEEARARQRLAGDQNLKQYRMSQESAAVSQDTPVVSMLTQPGRALVQSASEAKVSYGTAYKAKKIMKAAETDPEIAEAWAQAKQDKATVNQVYRQVQEKEKGKGKKVQETQPEYEAGAGLQPSWGNKRQEELEPWERDDWPQLPRGWRVDVDLTDYGKGKAMPGVIAKTDEFPPVKPWIEDAYRKLFPVSIVNRRKKKEKTRFDFPIIHAPIELIMHWLYRVADHHDIPREAMEGAIEMDSDILGIWDFFFRGLLSPKFSWGITRHILERWRKKQRAALPEHMPLPDDAKKLGRWPLDCVHRADSADLLREFPADSVHLVYSDVIAHLDQASWLGDFAARVLTKGHYLCVYVDKRQLPEAMARLTAAGLTYFWTCMVARPEDNKEMRIQELWRMLLIYRKGEAAAPWDWFEDGVLEKRPTNRGLIRQLMKGLTYKGHLVVDPFVGSGLTGQVARSMERRFLGFTADAEGVRAANQRISEIRLAENT